MPVRRLVLVQSASLIDPDYAVAANANLWFMIASTVMLTAVGWLVTARWVEPPGLLIELPNADRFALSSRAQRYNISCKVSDHIATRNPGR